jgi:hypothetical protein
VPNATDLAAAWRKWNAATAALRRLKFIRAALIAEQRKKNGSNPSSVVGAHSNLSVERTMFEALNYGPEQTSIYSYETVIGSITCCPYGCNSGRLEDCTEMEELEELETEAMVAVKEAHVQLRNAREQTTVGALQTPHNIATDHLVGNSPQLSARSEEYLAAQNHRQGQNEGSMSPRAQLQPHSPTTKIAKGESDDTTEQESTSISAFSSNMSTRKSRQFLKSRRNCPLVNRVRGSMIVRSSSMGPLRGGIDDPRAQVVSVLHLMA